MHVSFGHGLLQFGDKLYNTDRIESIEKINVTHQIPRTQINLASGKSDTFECSYEFGEIQKAFIEAQKIGYSYVDTQKDERPFL